MDYRYNSINIKKFKLCSECRLFVNYKISNIFHSQFCGSLSCRYAAKGGSGISEG